MENEFYRHYKDRVVPALRDRHKYKNVHQIPRVEKVVVNTSVGSQADLKQAMEEAKTEIGLITGQLPAETRAKKSIANFKLRKDQIIGAKGQANGGIYQFGVPRRDAIQEGGMEITPAGPMGVATAINFQPTGGGKAAITGDFVLTGEEVNPVIKELRQSGIEVTAIHSHMLSEQPQPLPLERSVA